MPKTATIDLKPGQLKRPMDRAAMGNDAATLRQLVGMLNDPNVTGAVVPVEEKEPAKGPLTPVELSALQQMQAEADAKRTQPAPDPQQEKETRAILDYQAQQKADPAKPRATSTVPATVPKRIFFTGHSRTGKSWLADSLAARVFGFDDPIYSMAREAFGEVQNIRDLDQFVLEVRAWGDGDVSTRFPLVPARAMFVEHIRGCGADGYKLFGIPVHEFGTAGFWNRCLIARVGRFAVDFPDHLIAVTDVMLADQYTALREASFRPYHVLCNALTRSSRGGNPTTNGLAEGIERDITQKLSQQPAGGKLWAIWNDNKYPSPSPRLLAVQEFFDTFAG